MFYANIDEDLKLKVLMPYDDAALFNLIEKNREYLKEWLPWLDNNTSVHDSRFFINSSFRKMSENEGFDVGIIYRDQLIGIIGFHDYDNETKKASLGYWVEEKCSRKGIITKTCKFLINYAFDKLKLDTIEIRTSPTNIKSKGVAEKLGFSFEKELLEAEWLYDHYVNHLVFSLKKENWTNPEI